MSATLVEPSAKVTEPKEPSLLWAASSLDERYDLIKAAMVRLAYSLVGVKLYDIEAGEIYWAVPNAAGTITVPDRRFAPIYRTLEGLECHVADIPPRTGNADKEA